MSLTSISPEPCGHVAPMVIEPGQRAVFPPAAPGVGPQAGAGIVRRRATGAAGAGTEEPPEVVSAFASSPRLTTSLGARTSFRSSFRRGAIRREGDGSQT